VEFSRIKLCFRRQGGGPKIWDERIDASSVSRPVCGVRELQTDSIAGRVAKLGNKRTEKNGNLPGFGMGGFMDACAMGEN
jgi:hypothetical protein